MWDYGIVVKKRAPFVPCKTRVSKLWTPLVVLFFTLLKVVVFDTIVVKWAKNPPKKKNLKWEFFSFPKGPSYRKTYAMKGKTKLLIIKNIRFSHVNPNGANVPTKTLNHATLFFP
jgi:hypothetical protein